MFDGSPLVKITLNQCIKFVDLSDDIIVIVMTRDDIVLFVDF